jgi:hypothetical protein
MRTLFHLFIVLFSPLAFALDSSVIQTTSESATLYHWFNAEKTPKQHLSAKLKPSDPKGFNYISKANLTQWIAASTNPVELRHEGGSDENWVLIELNVRPGFKLMELTPDFLSSSGCPAFSAKPSSLPATCLKALNETVATLGLDGLKLKTGEILITNGKYFRPSDVKLFNHFSTAEPEERLKIQSLFYKADFDHFKLGVSDSLFPSEISRLNPPFSGGGRGLLWDDLDGKPLDLGGQATRALSDQKTEQQPH